MLDAQSSYAERIMTNWSYDPKKFRELILFIAEKSAQDGFFADTHMNKVLFWSDTYALQFLGRPITGARYQKLEQGPAARALVPARNAMVQAGDVEIKKVHRKTVTKARRKPDLSLFADEELRLVERVIAWVGGRPAEDVSDESHKLSSGWKMMELKEDIPLGAQMIDTAPVMAPTRRRVERFAERYGW
jgi:hypothetical protein